MTDMYDKPKLHDGRLKPYPHAERNMVRLCIMFLRCLQLNVYGAGLR